MRPESKGENGGPPAGQDGGLFEYTAHNGKAVHDRCKCGNTLTAPEAISSGKCKPCRDKLMAGYESTAVRFQRRGDMTAVTFPYNPEIVDLLKASVPSFYRSWKPDRREWLILEPVYALEFADTLRALGHTVIGLDPPPQRVHATDPAEWARAVFRGVGPTRAPLVYKLLSGRATQITAGITRSSSTRCGVTAELPAEKRRSS